MNTSILFKILALAVLAVTGTSANAHLWWKNKKADLAHKDDWHMIEPRRAIVFKI